MGTDRNFPDDMQLCQNHLTIWCMYKTSEDEIQTAGSSDSFLLAFDILTRSYYSGSDPLEFVKTLRTAPMTTVQKSPSKLPKMSLKMNVAQVTLQRKDLATLNSRQWLNDLVVHAYLGVLAAAYNTVHAKGCYILPCYLATLCGKHQYSTWLYP